MNSIIENFLKFQIAIYSKNYIEFKTLVETGFTIKPSGEQIEFVANLFHFIAEQDYSEVEKKKFCEILGNCIDKFIGDTSNCLELMNLTIKLSTYNLEGLFMDSLETEAKQETIKEIRDLLTKFINCKVPTEIKKIKALEILSPLFTSKKIYTEFAPQVNKLITYTR